LLWQHSQTVHGIGEDQLTDRYASPKSALRPTEASPYVDNSSLMGNYWVQDASGNIGVNPNAGLTPTDLSELEGGMGSAVATPDAGGAAPSPTLVPPGDGIALSAGEQASRDRLQQETVEHLVQQGGTPQQIAKVEQQLGPATVEHLAGRGLSMQQIEQLGETYAPEQLAVMSDEELAGAVDAHASAATLDREAAQTPESTTPNGDATRTAESERLRTPEDIAQAEAPRREPPPPKLKWDNPDSVPTFGHTFTDHTASLKPRQLIDRAGGLGHQAGQWTDDVAGARLIAEVAQRGPGIYEVPLPAGLGRSFLADGTEMTPDMARVIVKKNGAVKTAYPYDSAHPN
jgi:hypothetical protein